MSDFSELDISDEADNKSQFSGSMFTNAQAALEYYTPDPADASIDEDDYLSYIEGIEPRDIEEYSDRLLMLLDYEVLHDRVHGLRWLMVQFVKYNCTRNHICWNLLDEGVTMLTDNDLYDKAFDKMMDTIIAAKTKNVFRTVNIVSLLYTQRDSERVIAKYDSVLDELLDTIYTPIGYGEHMYINAIIFRMLTDLDFPCVLKALDSKEEEVRKGTLRSELSAFHTQFETFKTDK